MGPRGSGRPVHQPCVPLWACVRACVLLLLVAQALQDFVVVHFSEAASGRPFHLSMAGPGAKPLTDMGQSLQAANVHASMLVVAWAA